MKKLACTMLLSLLGCFHFTFANAADCAPATGMTEPSFCTTFEQAGKCYCAEILGVGSCKDITTIYTRMMQTFHNSLLEACKYNVRRHPGVSVDLCMNQWSCFRTGKMADGVTNCNATGHAC